MIRLIAEGSPYSETYVGEEVPLSIPLDTIRRVVPKIDDWVIELNDGKTFYSVTRGIPLRFEGRNDVPCTVQLMPDMDSGYFDESDADGLFAEFDIAEVDSIYMHDYCEFSVRRPGQPIIGDGCPASYIQDGIEIRFCFG